MTPEQAADFINRYCNLGLDPASLLSNKPTLAQLIEAKTVGYAYVDVALEVLRVFHGIPQTNS